VSSPNETFLLLPDFSGLRSEECVALPHSSFTTRTCKKSVEKQEQRLPTAATIHANFQGKGHPALEGSYLNNSKVMAKFLQALLQWVTQ